MNESYRSICYRVYLLQYFRLEDVHPLLDEHDLGEDDRRDRAHQAADEHKAAVATTRSGIHCSY